MFNEKNTEYSKKQGKDIPVWQSQKYKEAKEKAIELINSKKYDLLEGDFWILMNETKNGNMQYSGLIISHNGCLKINDKLENKVDPEGFKYEHNGYKNSLIFTYQDKEIFEVGEVNIDNCKNDYPYAMAFKRCFDRVVLKKCKLAYAGVYSDSEAEEFTKRDDDDEVIPKLTSEDVKILEATQKKYKVSDEKAKEILIKYGYPSYQEVLKSDYAKIGNELSKGGK